MKIRREITKLNPAELLRFRAAMARLQTVPGNNPKYRELAALEHGHCYSSDGLFLLRNRAFLAVFEDALQLADENVTLPYWDWTVQSDPNNLVPKAFTDPSPNPLFSALNLAGTAPTKRYPDTDPRRWGMLVAQSVEASNESDFTQFSSKLLSVHMQMHRQIGGDGALQGDMNTPRGAAFDPIYYSFHAAIDRAWSLWQAAHSAVPPSMDPELPLGIHLYGWKVSDTFDTHSNRLFYEYSDQPNPAPGKPSNMRLAGGGA